MKEFFKRRLHRYQKKLEKLNRRHGDTPHIKYNYHGGFDMGYIRGKISALEDIIDTLEEHQTVNGYYL